MILTQRMIKYYSVIYPDRKPLVHFAPESRARKKDTQIFAQKVSESDQSMIAAASSINRLRMLEEGDVLAATARGKARHVSLLKY